MAGGETEAQSRTVTWPRPPSGEATEAVQLKHSVPLKISEPSGTEPRGLQKEAERSEGTHASGLLLLSLFSFQLCLGHMERNGCFQRQAPEVLCAGGAVHEP